ncbi:MAG: MFS transporter, partial [Verrucomicrobiales bacterium]|nr:MFS transporter [Verrucomicrobiales bacterium]
QITSRVVEMVELPIGQTMSYGQMSEIFFMLLMPLMFRRLGVKWMLAIGMLAWVGRYALFALGAPDQVASMILIGVVIHGICYDFFFVTGQIYTDDVAPKHLRGQAQGLLVLFTLGLGMLIGAQLAGYVEGQHTTAESKAFAAEFAANGEKIKELTVSIDDGTAVDVAAVEAEIAALEEVQPGLRRQELEAIEWKPLWGKPAIFAALVMVVFLVLFRDSRKPDEESGGNGDAVAPNRPPSPNQ